MTKPKKSKSKFLIFIRWLLWALLVQFILINISAALYAYKFTHLYSPEQKAEDVKENYSKNIFAKTWRLFKGPRCYKISDSDTPDFSYVNVVLKTKDGTSIEAWHGQADSISKGTVILFHGLTGNKATLLQVANEFRYWKYNVMLVDVRAHGRSGGNVTTIGFKESEEVKLAYDYIKASGEKNIYLWGASMGAVMIIKAVADYDFKPKGIIAEMPFCSLQSHIKARARTTGFPEQPFGFFVTFWIGAEHGFNGFGFNTAVYAKKITCPVLMQYGEKDQFVTKSETDNVYNAIASPDKKLVVYNDVGHRLLLSKATVLWRKEVEEFLLKSK